jgi:uncharacterized protein YndB with AHSA1/START domain
MHRLSCLGASEAQNRGMQLTRTSTLEAPAEAVWAAVVRADTFAYVAAPLLRFPAAELADTRWLPGLELDDRVLLFGFIPLGRHRIRIESVDEDARRLQTREGSRLLERWDHEISVVPIDDSSCAYTDRLEIEAVVLTPVAWVVAGLFFRYRHFRLRRLARELGGG